MIKASELRIGNHIMQKVGTRISVVTCSYLHFDLLQQGGEADLYPVLLKPEILIRCGFEENKKYALLPQAREFKRAMPVSGSGSNELLGYVKTNGECFGRAVLNGVPISNNFHHLHTLQNLYFALTGTELEVKP
jgi:hypothetical protein